MTTCECRQTIVCGVIERLVHDLDQLTKRPCERAGLVDGHRARPPDPFFENDPAREQPIDLSHHRGLVDTDGASKVGQRPRCPSFEEKLDQQLALGVGTQDRKNIPGVILHVPQYILRLTQVKVRSLNTQGAQLHEALATRGK